jgi:lysozyme family protein
MAEFKIAADKTLAKEGGYVCDPEDHGMTTRYGVSQKSYPTLDIKNLTIEQALEIYKKDYWDKINGDLINSQDIANKIFDIAINCGVFIASIKAQKTAKMVTGDHLFIDGVIGNKTLASINACDPQLFLLKFRELMLAYYESLNQPKFIRGWKIRLMSS